jgi:hypothetical protein
MRLLMLCGRTDLPEAACESLRVLLQDGIDWDVVWEAAHWHGVLPLLSHNLHAVAPRLVPDEMLERLRLRHQATAHQNLYMTAELLQLVGALEEAGIPSIPLKGAVLAHTLYPDPALREFSDIDILVREGDLSRAKQVLSSLGFLLTRSDLAGAQETAFRWRMYAYFFLRPTDGLVVDLHWKLAPTYLLTAIPVETLWDQIRSCRIGGLELRSFSPEVTLLLLCFHGAKHGPVPWPRLKWLCDLSQLLRIYPDLNWQKLFVSADASGCGRMVDLGLRLARELLGAPLPETIECRVRSDAAVASITALVGERLLQDRRGPINRLERMRQQLGLRERHLDKLLILVCHGFVPQDSDWRLVQLPPALAFLYFPLRILRLAFKFGLSQPLSWLGAKLRKRDSLAKLADARARWNASRLAGSRDQTRGAASLTDWASGPLSISAKLRLGWSIWQDYVRIRLALRRTALPEVVRGLHQTPVDRHASALEPCRLGRIVRRVIGVGPFSPRCLAMSLVLLWELRRQGTAAELVIGLPPEPTDHTAHAWVEVDGQVVGPPPGRLGHAELARYGASPSACR